MDKVKVILAKYWVVILCGVVALASVIANFWPLGGYHEDIQSKLKASAANYEKIAGPSGLLNKQRTLPMMPGQTEAEPLKGFPSDTIIAGGQQIRDQLDAESKKAYQDVVNLNKHTQLVAGVLPYPQSVGPLDFRKAYNDQFGPTGVLEASILNAGYPPSKEAIDAEGKRQLEEVYKPKIYRDANGNAMNEQQVEDEYKAAMLKLPREMQEAVAGKCKVYLNPDAIAIEPNVANVQALPPDPRTIWWAQLALWCQQDIAKAIADANVNAKNVTEAPIKRIWHIDLPQIGPTLLFMGKTAAATGGNPGPGGDQNSSALLQPADPNAPVTVDTKLSTTGRTCNGMYDVIQFRLELTVAFKDLPTVLQTLSKGRLITVLNVDTITTDDSQSAEKDGFLYGPDKVVRVSIRCEDLFLREWTTPLMPDSIKKLLGISLPPAAGT